MNTLTLKTIVTETETKFTKVSKNTTFELCIDSLGSAAEVKVINYTANVLTVCQTWGIDNNEITCADAVMTFIFEYGVDYVTVINAFTPSVRITYDDLVSTLPKSKFTILDNALVSIKEVEKDVFKDINIDVNTSFINDTTALIYTVLLNDDKNAVLFNADSADTIVVRKDKADIDTFMNSYTYIGQYAKLFDK